MLNLDLMKSPLNWLIVLLMVVTSALIIEVARNSIMKISSYVEKEEVSNG